MSARCAALACSMALATSGLTVAADPVEPAVRFVAPQGCPDRAAFLTHVRARTRTGTLAAREPKSVVTLDVNVTRRGASSFVAALTVSDAEGRKGTRRLTARTCREAIDGIALVTALTLDPSSPDAAGDTVAAAPSGATAGGATASGAASVTGTDSALDSPGENADGDTPPPQEGEAKPETPLEPSPRAKDPEGDQFPKLPLEPAKPAAPSEVRAGELPSHLSAGLTMLGLASPIPGLTPALEISAEGRTEITRALDVGFRGALRISKGGELSTTEGDASFEWWAIAAGVCPGAHTPTDALSLALCALLEQGQTHARGIDTENPRSARRGWTSLGPALRVRWALVPRAAIEVGADALFPFRRDTFSLGALQVYEVPSVAFRFGAGVAFRFQ